MSYTNPTEPTGWLKAPDCDCCVAFPLCVIWPYWIVYMGNMTDVSGGTETAYYSGVNGVTPLFSVRLWCPILSFCFTVLWNHCFLFALAIILSVNLRVMNSAHIILIFKRFIYSNLLLHFFHCTNYTTKVTISRLTCYMKNLNIPKGQTDSASRRRIDTTMANRKGRKEQSTIYKTLHRKPKIEQHEPH